MDPSSPSARKAMPSHHHGGQQPFIQSQPEMMDTSNMNQNQRTDWADAGGQVDFFAGFNNDSIFTTALTPGARVPLPGGISISPLRRSGRSAPHHVYPSQELNPSYAGRQEITPLLASSSKLPPLPPPLPPVMSDGISVFGAPSMAIGQSKGLANELDLPEDVTSMGALSSLASKIHADEARSSGLTQDLEGMQMPHMNRGEQSFNVLDSFEIDSVGEEYTGTGQPKTEGLDEYSDDEYHPMEQPKRVSTSPSPKAKRSTKRATKSRKKSKGKSKNTGAGIRTPTVLDILRGRGGLTNRHEGNMRFRDEARSMRGDYRDVETTRQEKFLLSQELVRRVKEYGGRFLERGDNGLWFEMSAKDQRKKASQVLREEKWD